MNSERLSGWTLPNNMRRELKESWGDLIAETKLVHQTKYAKEVIAVGDMTALTLNRYGIPIRLAVVDFKTKREDLAHLKAKISEIGDRIISVDNPAGMITTDLWDAVEEALRAHEDKEACRGRGRGGVRIEVRGEEDLATIPCILLAPEGAVVVYGMPDKGLVVVKITSDKKRFVRSIFRRFDPYGDPNRFQKGE